MVVMSTYWHAYSVLDSILCGHASIFSSLLKWDRGRSESLFSISIPDPFLISLSPPSLPSPSIPPKCSWPFPPSLPTSLPPSLPPSLPSYLPTSLPPSLPPYLPPSSPRQAHTVTALVIFVVVLVYMTFIEETSTDSSYNMRR